MKYLLHGDVIAGAIRGRLPVVLALSRQKPADVAVSAVSRMEAESALRLQPGPPGRKARLLRDFFGAVRTLEFGAREAQQAAGLAPYLRGEGERLSALDLMVAATALAHQLTLVTERTAVFAGVPNLEVESWDR